MNLERRSGLLLLRFFGYPVEDEKRRFTGVNYGATTGILLILIPASVTLTIAPFGHEPQL